MKYINGKYYGVSTEIDDVNNAEDLAIFNCLDTGVQYRFFEGKWYKQPVYWTDRDDVDSGSGLPAVTASDNGDVLTVVDGAWDKAAPSGGVMVLCTTDEHDITATWNEVKQALQAGTLCVASFENSGGGITWTAMYVLTTAYYSEEDGYVIGGVSVEPTGEISAGPILVAESADGVLDTF